MRLGVRIAILAAIAAALALVALVAIPKAPAATGRPRAAIQLTAYLPRDPVTDGSVDYTALVQRAIEAAAGRALELAPFPVLVSPPAGANACLVVREPTRIAGGPGARLVTRTPAVQLLRVEDASGVVLDGFELEGAGGVGRGLGHGLLQAWRCRELSIRGVTVRSSDADGIAVADCEVVRVESCTVEAASKAGIYLSRCRDGIVAHNVVRDGVGHVTANGETVGAAILFLSVNDVLCATNVIDGGVGAGILCGSLDGGAAPDGVAITGNRIRGVSNPTNPGVSSGIQLANGAADSRTHLLVASNSIRACGQHGILIENHDGALIQGNSIEDSWLSAIAVAHARGTLVLDNAILDANVALLDGQAGVYLHDTTSACVVRGNECFSLAALPSADALPAVIDRAPTGGNTIE